MNEFEKKDWEREESPAPEEAGPAPEPWPQGDTGPETPPAPEAAAPAEGAEPQAEAAEPEETGPRYSPAEPVEPPRPAAAPEPPKETPPAGEAQAPGGFYQGNGYYAPPQQPQGGAWQGQYPQQQYQQPGAPYGGGQPGYNPYGPQYAPGWQQGAAGPRTTGWQQPQWGYGGPNTTGWNQPPQQNPWQAGGYRPQGQAAGEAVPGQWQGAPAAPKKKKHPFLKGLLIFLGAVAAGSVITLAGYGLYAAVTGENPWGAPESSFLPPEPSTGGGSSLPDVSLRDKPGEGTDSYDGSAKDGGLSNTEIYKKNSPSVVAIVVSDGSGFYAQKGIGSGIIMSEDGYIITNGHVAQNGVDFEVILAEGDESYKAQVVGVDTRNDLAVLKIDAQGLVPAEFGNSEQTEVGERVCVIGNPLTLNFRNTLTVGYVSALNREIRVDDRTISYIQTDAAINPGNSGGPLINAFGQVIGISTAKIVLPEYEGMCFAIPISDAMPIIRELIANGKVTGRAILGITAKAVKATEAEYYEIPLGLWVNSVNPGADIGAKGVREGDIITHLAGEPVYTLDACSRILGKYQPGDTISVTVFRRESSLSDTTFTAEIVLESS